MQFQYIFQNFILQTQGLSINSMQTNGHRASYLKNQYNSLNKNTTSKSSYSLNHRPVINYNLSPRPLADMRDRDESISNVGQKMRLMKSRLNNISIHSRNGWNQNNLYPGELIFLLSNQQGNVEHMRNIIQEEKKRVNRDFQNFSRQIIHLIEDLKLSFTSKLDFVFRDYINIYRNLKDQVVRMRDNRKRILMNRPIEQYENKSSFKSQAPNNNTSNLNLLQEISKDQDYFKNHKIYEQVTNAYFEAIGPIMNDAQNILSIGSQIQFYKDQKCNQVLNNIRNSFFNNTKQIFQNQLDNLVTQVSQIAEDNNMLLKDLNDQPKYEKNQYSNYVVNQKQQKSSVYPVHVNNKKKKQVESNPYGFEVPTFKNHVQPEPEKIKGLRPSSSSEHLKYRARPQSQWSSRKNLFEGQRQKYATHVPPQSQQKIIHYNVTKDEQNVIAEWAQSPRFKNNQVINAENAQDMLLCLIFIDSQHIAVGSKDRNIYIYSISTGRMIQTLSGHRASVCSLSNFSNFFASGGDNGCSSLILWDANQWKMKKKINVHSAALTCIVDMLDGSHLATGGYDKKIFIYNYKKSQTSFEVNSSKSGVTSMAICEQSRRLISAGLDSTLTIWNIFTRNGEVDAISLQRIVTSCGLVCSLRPLLLSPEIVLVGNKDGKVIFVNINSGQTIKTVTVGRGSVIEMSVIQRKNKPLFPLILSCCSGQRQMIITRSESGSCESTKVRINLGFGCGIGPKVVLEQSGLVAIVSQSAVQKQVSLYSMEIS